MIIFKIPDSKLPSYFVLTKDKIQIMKVLRIFALCIFSFFASGLIAQDQIIKKNGDKIKVHVKEINDTQIKYVEVGDPNEIIFTIDRALIKEIKFSYGGKYKEEAPEEILDFFAEDKNSNLMINFTAISNNTLILGYEKAIDQGSSFDVQLKLLGYGISDGSDDSGIAVDVGYKLKFGSLRKNSGDYRPKHLMHGSYFKPVIGFGGGTSNSNSFTLGQFGLQIGKQWVIQSVLTIDLYGGFHFYTGSGNGDFDFIDSINFGDFAGSENRAGSFGFRVGYLFGQYGYKKEKKSKR